MQYNKSKSTKRFNFNINRDTVSHKAGSNTVSITTNFQSFLNSYIDSKTTTID